MIESLHISNYALIDAIDIDFTQGFNIITGETGAGKSIMLGALSLILGERADIKAIRDTSKKTIIEAVFSANNFPALKQYCSENDIDWMEDGQLIVRRELATNGRSRAFINDTPVNLSTLRDVTLQLVDIHSQHQNQLLTTADYQLQIIDNLADNAPLLKDYRKIYDDFKAEQRRLNDKISAMEKDRQDSDYMQFQLEQLDELQLVAGEQEQLEHDRDVLNNMTDIKQYLANALESLTNGSSNALELLDNATDNCRELTDVLEDADSLAQRLDTARIEIQDVTETLQDYNSQLQADPAQLEEIEQRLDRIYELEHKHHVDSVEKLIDIANSLRQKINAIENFDDTIAEMKQQCAKLKKEAIAQANVISQRRKVAAKKFGEQLKERALPLGMKNLQCEIVVKPTTALTPTGLDSVIFTFAFNKNQQLMPVGDTASGGEISRLVLSIKSLIAEKMQLPSIIFDEVDTGVSGDVANRMGEMMNDISRRIQVITITHLPQVAAKGDSHFKVYKEDDEHTTMTRIRRLSSEERIDELALMLSGSTSEATARATAKKLLETKL
jgi:DNA repair protein RecN (Recombination protein N)